MEKVKLTVAVDQSGSDSRLRTLGLASLLGMVVGVGPLVHYSVSALGPLIVDDLSLSATKFGLLWLVTFGAASCLTVTGGTMSDRYAPRNLFLVVFALAGAGLLVVGGARSFGWLVVGLALSGLAQSFSNPATNTFLATRIAESRRGLALGLKQSGVQVGQMLAGLALPPLALVLGWRRAVLMAVTVAAIGFIITAVAIPATRTERAHVDPGHVRLTQIVVWLTVYGLLMGLITQATNVYLPLYAHSELGASVTEAGLIVAALGGVGVVARLAWGGMSGRAADVSIYLTALAALAMLAVLAFLAAAWVGMWVVWLGAALFSFSALASNVLVMLVVVKRVPAKLVGRATGWVSLGLYVGFMIGPVSTGLVVDWLGFTAAWTGLLMVCGALAAVALRVRTAATVPEVVPARVTGASQ